MRVESFKVSNYRSIATADIDLADLTCLVGPNNEGKSNLLRALGLGLTTLLGSPRRPRTSARYGRYRSELIGFDPETDRPIALDARALTTITIRFELTARECDEFYSAVGHTLNGDLPVQIQFTARGPSIQYKKQRVGSELTRKADQIGEFLRQRMTFLYVPPIRTADDAAAVIDSLLRARVSTMATDDEYVRALDVISTKTADAMKLVEDDLKEVLGRFLPNVRDVHLDADVRDVGPTAGLGVRSVVVDDGTATELYSKGSGVQSLAALALLRHDRTTPGRNAVLALEEPEAHLHNAALHQLRPLLAEIAREQQLIFATHSGILVPTTARARRVIVRNNQAATARSMADVRDALGVRLADNLSSARVVCIVEGELDRLFWQSVLRGRSSTIDDALDQGSLDFELLSGTGNLGYQIEMMRRSACDVFVVLDADAAGRQAINRALDSGSLRDADYLMCAMPGFHESELEDVFDVTWCENVLATHFGVRLSLGRDTRKWSDRLRSALAAANKTNSKEAVARGKIALSEAMNTDAQFDRDGNALIDDVVQQLEARLIGP